VTHSTKQEKKRKRPDDKKQGISKKLGGRQETEQSVGTKKGKIGYDQDHSGQKMLMSSGGKPQEMDVDFEPNQSDIQDEGIEDLYENEFDEDKAKQMEIAAEIAVAENISEFEDDDYLQDDIPIDEDDDEDDGMISDNYENLTKEMASPNVKPQRPMTGKTPLDENVISMEHSDDLMESSPVRIQDGNIQMNTSQGGMESDPNYEEDEEDEEIDDNYPEEDEMDMDDEEIQIGLEDILKKHQNKKSSKGSDESSPPVQVEGHEIEDSGPITDQFLKDKSPAHSSPSGPILNETSPANIDFNQPKSMEGTQ
jgi:hypothetical protein